MKIAKKILVILIIICILPIPKINVSEAVAYTSDQASIGKAIANFAMNAVSHSSEFHYVKPALSSYRIDSYNNMKTYYCDGTCNGSCSNGAGPYYGVDCNAFVGFVVHHSINIGPEQGTSVSNITVAGPGAFSWSVRGAWSPYFEKIAAGLSSSQAYSQAIPGDLVASNGDGGTHIQIYVGNNSIVDCAGYYPNAIKMRSGAQNNIHSEGTFCIFRIKDEAAKKIKSVNTWVEEAGTKPNESAGGNTDNLYDDWIFDEIDESTYNKYKNEDYYWDGLQDGTYEGNGYEANWLFNFLEDALDWILGIMFMGVKIQIVGWTTLFEIIITNIVDAMSGDMPTKMAAMSEKMNNIQDRLTVEKIVFNKVPILDANIFNPNNAGGQELDGSTVIGLIRENIAGWYYGFRTLTIIVMLILLLYIGIRLALSSTGEKKAEYKKLLINWLYGFIMVFCIHYFMVLVFNVNGIILSMVQYTGNEESLYEQIRAHIYEIPFKTSMQACIIYIILVYYLVRFIIFYLKRLFTLLILIILAPLLIIFHIIKKVQSPGDNVIGTWGKEFTFNVLIQSVHAILYVIFASVTLKIAASGGLTQIVLGSILIFLIFQMILTAESLLKKMFGMQGKTMKSLGEALTGVLGGYLAAKDLLKSQYKTSKKVAGKIANATNKKVRTKEIENNIGVNNTSRGTLRGTLGNAGNTGTQYATSEAGTDKSSTFSDIEKQLEALREKDMKAMGNYTKLGASAFGNILGAVPTAFIMNGGPLLGLSMVRKGVGQLRQLSGYRKEQNKHYFGKRMLAHATLGTSSIVESLYNKSNKEKEKYTNEFVTLTKAKDVEGKLINDLDEIKRENPLMFRGYEDDATNFEKVYAEKGEKELEQALNRELGIVPSEKELKEAIATYMVINNKRQLEASDCQKIAEYLGLSVGKFKGQEAVETVKHLEEEKQQMESMGDWGSPAYNAIVKQIEEAKQASADKNIFENNLDKAYDQNFNISFGSNMDTKANSTTTKTNANTSSKPVFSKKIENMKIDEVAEVMHEALKMKDSIITDSDEGILNTQVPIIKQVRELKNLNEQMTEIRGTPIYNSPETLKELILKTYRHKKN